MGVEFIRLKTLRLSVTSQCNLRCNYCTDISKNGDSILLNSTTNSSASNYLSSEETLRLVEDLHRIVKFEKVRITGGEPTLSKHLIDIIKGLSDMGIDDLRMTTNGTRLNRISQELFCAGVKSVNISLDALDPEIFYTITQENSLPLVLDGIQAAINSGLKVKLNTVVMAGVNDKEIVPILEYAMQNKVVVRFLELMEMGNTLFNHKNYLFSRDLILKRISIKYTVEPMGRIDGRTASMWSINGVAAFGIISNYSEPFCGDCNRLRMDAYGNILGCIGAEKEIPLRTKASIKGASQLKSVLYKALDQKEEFHFTGSSRSMKTIGG